MSATVGHDAVDRVSALYEPHVMDARDLFHQYPVIGAVTSPQCDPKLLDRFLIQFCAQGVKMTEHVEGWIRRAGERTVDVGYVELGEALQRHAEHERDHHLLMIDDTQNLVDLWNNLGREPLSAEELLESEATPGVVAYVNLHEETIAGPTPYAQLGIEYEIERLSITEGVALMKNVAVLCGSDRVEGLSFLQHHIELDQGHTEFNRRQLDQLLADYPELAEPLAAAGSSALAAYGQFMADCMSAVA